MCVRSPSFFFFFSPPMQSGKRLKESFGIFPFVCFFHCARGQFLFTAGRTIYCREVHSMHSFDFFFYPCNCGKWLHPLLFILTNPDFICVSAQKKKTFTKPSSVPGAEGPFFFFFSLLFCFSPSSPTLPLPPSLCLLSFSFIALYSKAPLLIPSKAQTKNLSRCHLLHRAIYHRGCLAASRRGRGGAGAGGRVKDFHAQQKNLSQLFMALAGTHNRTHQTAVFLCDERPHIAGSLVEVGHRHLFALHIQFPRQWRSTWGSDSDKYWSPHGKPGRLLHE